MGAAASPVPKDAPKPAKPKPKLGLRAWMHRVLEECDRAAKGFEPDPVHDLRVALRRCRSLADGLMAIDPDPSWKDMKKAGKKLFQALGDLRDMQVIEEWIAKLSPASGAADAASRVPTGDRSELASADPVAVKLLDHVHAREAECKQQAAKALQQFDRKQWRQWSRTLPHRASRVRPGSVVYQHLALEKWTAAHDLHQRALRTRSQFAWHQLRIGIKRFRYTVENFLPRQHALWGSDLKELQDLLGEVHDLDVLWALAVEIGAFPDAESRSRWREKLNLERDPRLARYREKMVGRESLWRVWRAELPSGERLRRAAMSRLRVWAGFQDPDFSHSKRVARLAILLYDGLKNAGLITASAARPDHGANPRAVLRAAAFMHDAGKAKGAENYQKQTYRMIRGLARPMGWSARELELAAVVARYHRGTLPRPRGKAMQLLELPDRPIAMELAGILRLANALSHHQGERSAQGYIKSASAKESIPQIEVSLHERCVLLRVEGYSALDRSAEGVAAARHLLETVLRRPVLVRALAVRSQKPTANSQKPTAQ
ncbi:MAG: CHAD domain-containing protein [Terriglobales bacterium]